MLSNADALELVDRIRDPTRRTPSTMDQYYTHCIPIFREFLGDHWHTGYYRFDDRPIGLADQLRMEQHVAIAAGLNRDCQALEVGCGIGGPARHLAKFTGARIRGLTPNAMQLDLAKKLTLDAGVTDRVTFDQGWASELPYPDDTFDVVLFFESPCHFPDRSRFFREVQRVLRPRGRLAGEDWLAMDGLSQRVWARYIQPICETWAIPELGTRTEYASAMAAAGLTVKEARDLRDEMPLLRGFVDHEADQAQIRQEQMDTTDPFRKMVLEGLLRLGKAAAKGAFTLGLFLAVKE